MPIKYAWKYKLQYDRLEKGISRYIHRERVNFILKAIEAITADKFNLSFLDLGCGDGVLTRYISQNNKLKIVAMDSDIDRLKRAKKLNKGSDIGFLNADLNRICFKSSKADIILLHHVLEHIDDDLKILKDCFSMLKLGGFLILGIPNEDSLLGKISRLLHKDLYKKGEHFNFYSESSINKAIEDAGFKVEKLGRIGFLFPVYYVHMLLISNPITFSLGNVLTKIFKVTADSLIVIARKEHE